MKIAILGAGAAGCFAAANLPNRINNEVIIFEKNNKPLQKVKVSGGGRCNVTHACFDVQEMASRYPRGANFMKKTLHQFGPQQTIHWFQTKNVPLKEEEDDRVFPISDNSQSIIDCILNKIEHNNILIKYNKSVENIVITKEINRQFLIYFTDKTTYQCNSILIATGGFPKLEQFKWIENLGHSIIQPAPSLFTFNLHKQPITELMGVSVPEVTLKISGTKIAQSGAILLTHWGLSGPVVLKTSAIAARLLAEQAYKFTILINWLNTTTEESLKETILNIRKEQGKQNISNKNPFQLPKRLWEYFLKKLNINEETRWAELTSSAQNQLIEVLLRDNYQVMGKTTFKEEFVTCGGVSLSEINPQTMESRITKGLFFAGEIMDVDGITGGYNFQHAWSSGWIAAMNILG